MLRTSSCLALLLLGLQACSTQPPKSPVSSKLQPRPKSLTPEADRLYRPPSMLWWQGEHPTCLSGNAQQRQLSWGAIYWCTFPGQHPDANLQNNLGRLARCVHDSIQTFQREPNAENLAGYLADAHASGLHPVVCGSIDRNAQVQSYHGHPIAFERSLLPAPSSLSEPGSLFVRYRFSCEDCLVASETRVKLHPPQPDSPK